MKSTKAERVSFTIHTAQSLKGEVICTSCPSEGGYLYERWGVLSEAEIAEGEERGEELERWPDGCWVEGSLCKWMAELELGREISCLSWDEAGVAFSSLDDARKAIASAVTYMLQLLVDEQL